MEIPFAQLQFRVAADEWLELKRPFIGRRTIHTHKESIKQLGKYFAEISLKQITIDHLRAYQRLRLTNSKGACINRELGTLRSILREAELWEGSSVKNKYKPIPLPHLTPGRALSDAESERLFQVARLKKRWQVAFYASVLSANTAAGPGEIRGLQLRDIDLESRKIQIRREVKNRFRVRDLELNDDAFAAVTWLVERARAKGASRPEHYVLPHRAANRRDGWDFTRPMYSWNTAWKQIREAAGLPRLRMYDLRHTALTNLYSNPLIPERAIVEIAGWSNSAMAARYAHIRSPQKRTALLGLSAGVLSNGTSTAFATAPMPSQKGKPVANIEPKPPQVSTVALMLKGRA